MRLEGATERHSVEPALALRQETRVERDASKRAPGILVRDLFSRHRAMVRATDWEAGSHAHPRDRSNPVEGQPILTRPWP